MHKTVSHRISLLQGSNYELISEQINIYKNNISSKSEYAGKINFFLASLLSDFAAMLTS
jgi:hypothetical protein